MSRAPRFCLLFVFLAFPKTFAQTHKLPPSVTPCKRSDPSLDACINKQAKIMYGSLINGNSELGVPNMRPLKMGNFTVSNGINGLTIKAIDGIITGITEDDLQDVKLNFANRTGVIHLVHNIDVACKHSTRGRILALPLIGNGRFKVMATRLDWLMFIQWDLVKGKDGENHMKIKKSRSEYKLADMKFQLNGLLNKQIDEAMSILLSDNWRDVVAEIGDPGLQVLQKKYTDILNKIFSRIPYKEFLSD